MKASIQGVNAYPRRAKDGEGFELVIKSDFGKQEKVVRQPDGEPFETKEAAFEGGKEALFAVWRVTSDLKEKRKQLKDILRTRWYLSWWILRGLAVDPEKQHSTDHHAYLLKHAKEAEQAFWLLDPGPDSWKQPLSQHHRVKSAADAGVQLIRLINRELAMTSKDINRLGKRMYPIRWEKGWQAVSVDGDEGLQLTGWPFPLAKDNEYVTLDGIMKRRGSKVPGWMPGEGPINWPTFLADEEAAREKSGIDNHKWALKLQNSGMYEPT